MYLGIVNDRGVLRAEFGPKMFMHAESKYTSTIRANSELLKIRIQNSAGHPAVLADEEKALHELTIAQMGIEMGLVKIEDFPLPEPSTDMSVYLNAFKQNPGEISRAFSKHGGGETSPVSEEAEAMVEWSLSLSRDGEYKPLPAALQGLNL